MPGPELFSGYLVNKDVKGTCRGEVRTDLAMGKLKETHAKDFGRVFLNHQSKRDIHKRSPGYGTFMKVYR
jgi:hypothetical protein